MTRKTYTEEGKLCRACDKVKPLSAFYNHKRDGKQSLCKICTDVKNRVWAAKNRERLNACQAEWKRRNPEKVLAMRQRYNSRPEVKARKAAQWLSRKYSLSVQAFEQLLADQNGCCAICGEVLVQPNVDHDHATGVIRGILCSPCNKALGLFGDSPARLQAAAAYLGQ